MADDKPRPGLADYVTIALSPALIIAMIVSLVFFLLAILYRGEYANRLHVILFSFVFGMVLVARIALETGYEERAPLYGIVLAFLVWLGMGSLVRYPPEMAAPSWLINAGLIALAWWLSYRLVYSCTYIDEKADNTGTGVLQAAGLDLPAEKAGPPEPDAVGEERPSRRRAKGRSAHFDWWQRYRRFASERQKQQPPGLWVVYFGLAALPVFGLGQALIEAADEERRAQTFFYMSVYIASSLGLLVTTAFLGLRRYLRQRRLDMPVTVTAAWLALGALLVAALTTIGAALPRPQSEYTPLDWVRATSDKRKASRFALTRGETGTGQGQAGAEKQDPDAPPAKSGSGNPKTNGGKGEGKGGGNSAKQSGQKQVEKSGTKNQDAQAQGDSATDATKIPEAPPLPAPPTGLKWLVFGILALIALFVLTRNGLRYLANFSNWARRLLDALSRLWEDLFAWRRQEAAAAGAAKVRSAPPPFRAFANPFRAGQAARMKPADLVRYSFEALEAWAGERACGRVKEETPTEFTERLACEVGELDSETLQLGNLYGCVLYADGTLPANWRGTVEQFWQRLPSGER